MSNMKCPVCNKGTVTEFETAPYFACSNEFCPSYSETDTTEYDILIRTRKALDVAKDGLKSAQRYICSDKKSYQIIQTAIEQITALTKGCSNE